MPWWVWVLLAWSALAVALGLVLGRALRTADRRENRRGPESCRQVPAEPGEPEAEERPCAS